MNTLFIDTHKSKNFSIGYSDSENKLTVISKNDANMEAIDAIYEISNNKPISKIIIINGPGSLSGLRIGASFALGIAVGKNIKVFSLNLFDIILRKYPNCEIIFNTGTKKWIKKTSTDEIITENDFKTDKKWISNDVEKLSQIYNEINLSNQINYPNIINLMHEFQEFAEEKIDLIYAINSFI